MPRTLTLFALALFAQAPTARESSATVSPPTFQLLVAPANGDTVFAWSPFAWEGRDQDGTIAFYRYAIDAPAFGDTFWVETTQTFRYFAFACRTPVEPVASSDPVRFAESHTFVAKAVDNDGLESNRDSRSFASFTIAPDVAIVDPVPNPASFVMVPSNAVTISWDGYDWDGRFTTRPVRYLRRLMTRNFPFIPGVFDNIAFARAYPDSFRKVFAPAFTDWDQNSGDSTFASFTNLNPGSDYLFCVVGFDEVGAYSARFSPATNILWFRVPVGTGVEPRGALSLRLGDPSPSPARTVTTIAYSLAHDGEAELDVVDAAGRRFRTLASGSMPAGERHATWNLTSDAGRPAPPGIYFVRLETPGSTLSRRLVVLR